MSKQIEDVETLSKRELEVAKAYAEGASYKEIARDLGISPTTVRSHLRTVYGKLSVTSKIALAQALADPAAAVDVTSVDMTAELALELDDAIRRERAMSRVLRIISESDTGIDDVIDEVLDHALEICEAEFGILMEHHGDYQFTEMRSRNISPAFAAWLAGQGMFNPGPETAVGRSARALTPVSITDVGGEGINWEENPLRKATVEYGRARSLAAIPMTASGHLIGVFSVYRTRVHPFNDRALELAQSFADQAAIAIENARQIRAMEAQLEQSLATREILDAISGSRSDEKPVFDLILSRARHLCAADAAALTLGRQGDEAQTLAAAIDMHPTTRALYTAGKVKMNPKTSIVAEAIVSGQIRHVADYAETDGYKDGDEVFTSLVDDTGMRTSLIVPLASEGTGIGALVLYRREPRAYAADQIKLVETFAAQAVIAVENVQQFRAMEARLEQSAATREVLDAISSARDDEGPVFDAILGNARKLCDAPFAALVLGRESDCYQTMIAHHGAVQSTEDIYSEARVPMDPTKSFAARAIIEKRPVHLPNMKDTDEYRAGVPNIVELCDLQGIRTNLFVPLIKDGVGIGCFIIFRHEVRPYSDEQIALVETFATQAVIALENVRQFRDLQTRLDREAATRDVLEVINQSRDDALPVFEAILKKAVELCGADAGALALGAPGDAYQRMATSFGVSQATIDVYGRGEVTMNPDISLAAKAIVTGQAVHVEDMADTEGYRSGVSHFVTVVDDSSIRTNLFVPLMTAEGGAGVLILFRKEVKPYSQDEIALVETFAAQAAIALENVRQFREVQARLERELATKEVLSVISQSRNDETPVFKKILALAKELCDAEMSTLLLVNADRTALNYIGAAGKEVSKPDPGFTIPFDDPVGVATAARTGEVVNNPDLKDTDLYRQGHPERVRLVDREGVRSQLAVPLLQDDQAIGVIGLNRREQKAFSADEIALIESFTAQAVIAIENVRQFKALEARTSEVQALNASLEAKVEEQVGEIARMGQLKQFMAPAVADALVSSGDEKALSSHRALIATLFCDIRGFTAFCETAEPEETIEVLQAYHEQMGELISAHGGGVDKRMGDGIMVIFNDPLPCDDPAGDAVRLAIAMRAGMRELAKKWKKLGHRLGFGVGVSLGYATVGMVGSAGRFDYTASGTAVNTAARLCDIARDGEILLSPRAWAAVEDDFQSETRGAIEMKGIREPIEVFTISDS